MRTHGTASTYKNGCRCHPCLVAHRIAARDYRARRRADPTWTPGAWVRHAVPKPSRVYPFQCGVCDRGMDGHAVLEHPIHTDVDLAETKLAVDLAAKVLTVDVLLWMASTVIEDGLIQPKAVSV